MGATIRARFTRGVLKPLQKLELSEGSEVVITIVDKVKSQDAAAFRRSAGAWKGTLDAPGLVRKIYSGRLVSSRPKPRL